MPIIEGAAMRPVRGAGAPSAGTSAVQTLTIGGTPTGGTFRLKFEGLTTGDITWSSTNVTLLANMNAAFDALATTGGAGGLVATAGTVTSGIGTVTITAASNRARQPIGLITVADNSLTGTSPTLAMANTTPGVAATARGLGIGTMYVNETDGVVSVNTGTALIPVWTHIGAQT